MERYLYYLKNVLGLKTVLTKPAESVPLYIYVQDLETYSDSEKELLNKMIVATKLLKNDYLIQSFKAVISKNSDQHVDHIKVYLLDEPQADQNDETYSPRILLKHPELKKTAWEALQRAMLKFSQK